MGMNMDNHHERSAGPGHQAPASADNEQRTDARELSRADRRQEIWDGSRGRVPAQAGSPTSPSLQTESAAHVSLHRRDSPPAKAADSCQTPPQRGLART